MVVSVIGWYGTETLGDVAILDGILSVLDEFCNDCEVLLGSLHPSYSERTLFEEKSVFKRTAPNIKISLFNSYDKKECKRAVESSDLVLVGGGPLMHIGEMYIIKRCFSYAKENKIPTMIMGCGVGPLVPQNFIQVFKDIIEKTDFISFRNEISCLNAQELVGKKKAYLNLGDPAVISIENFKKISIGNSEKSNEIVINFRDYPQQAYGNQIYLNDDMIKNYLLELSENYNEVKLIPMHTFALGIDDRVYLSSLVLDLDSANIKVEHKPKNLDELYSCYMNAEACGGMRYHSVVMQTILNGNNIVFDYTDKTKGKIAGYLKDVDKKGFYNNRIIHLTDKDAEQQLQKAILELAKNESFEYEYTTMKRDYVDFIKKALG